MFALLVLLLMERSTRSACVALDLAVRRRRRARERLREVANELSARITRPLHRLPVWYSHSDATYLPSQGLRSAARRIHESRIVRLDVNAERVSRLVTLRLFTGHIDEKSRFAKIDCEMGDRSEVHGLQQSTR